LFGLSLLAIPFFATKENSQNIFSNELTNGVYKFYLAFMNSELDYFKFYKTPEKEVYAILGQQILALLENLP
jgi:hypothetical protein